MKGEQGRRRLAGQVEEPTESREITDLAQRLAETEAALQAITAGQVDAVVDSASGLPILLHEAQAELRRAHDELEGRVRERTAELARSNRLLQALIETMPVGAVITDAEGQVLSTNAAGRNILGSAVHGTLESPERAYTPHYVDGTPLPAEEMPLMHALKEGQAVHDVEILIRRADREERTILASAAPVLDEAGKIMSGIAIFQDMTERQETQRAMQLYADRLHILHSAGQAILTGESVDEIIKAVLPFMRELVRCKRASVLALDREVGEAIVLGAHSSGETRVGQGTRIPLDESWSWEDLARGEISVVEDVQSGLMEALQAEGVRFVVNVPLVAQGELLGAVNLGFEEPVSLSAGNRDIVRQMADELAIGLQQIRLHEAVQRHADRLEEMVARRTAALRTSEARFRAIFEDSVLGIALLDAEGCLVAGNPALQDMLGYRQEELVGTAFSNYGHADDAATDKDLFQAVAAGDLGYYQVEKRYVRSDGQVRWCELTVSRVQTTRWGEPRRAIAMVADITERKMSHEALLRAERLAIAGRLGASLAHEINNPLQAVIGCLGLVEEMVDDGAKVQPYLEIAMEELERAAGIVTQLRDLGRAPKSDQVELCDLNALVEKALLLTRKSCQNAGIEVEWIPANDLSPVRAVPTGMQQVFLNLLLNAVAAMPRGGRLQVSTTVTGQPEGVHLRFADTGVGIEPDNLPSIFEPFHSTRPDGLGLGLYISKRIVEEHGGHIEVDSRVGEGTTFTVWVPC